MTDNQGTNGLSPELAKAIRDEATKKAAQWVVTGAGALLVIAAVGWWTVLKPYIVSVVGGVPPDAVVAFDRRCSEMKGWGDYTDGAGKFLLGAGEGVLRHRGLHQAPAGVPAEVKLTRVELGDQGGGERVTLSENEVASHNHGAGSLSVGSSSHFIHHGDGRPTAHGNVLLFAPNELGAANFGAHNHTVAGETGANAGDDSHNNMPPFIALYFCKKEAG